jgi:hypothetical protein
MIAGFPEVLPPHEVAPGARTGNSMTAPRSACSALRERGGKQESQRLMGEASAGSDIEQPASPSAGSWADVLALPPMPTPDYCAMRGEACCGNSLVIFLIFLFVAPMHAYASSNPLTMTMKVWMFAIYAEAATAIICLLGLMWGDPGTVKRTPDTCFPQPEIVADRLRKGQDLRNVGNVTEDGRVFCIRCLVWRPETSDVHHCGTCQRCVEEFDHHCGVRAPAATVPLSRPLRLPPRAPAAHLPRGLHFCRRRPPLVSVRRAGIWSLHRRRRLRRQHGLLQDADHDGGPRLRDLRFFHVRDRRRRPIKLSPHAQPLPHRPARRRDGCRWLVRPSQPTRRRFGCAAAAGV